MAKVRSGRVANPDAEELAAQIGVTASSGALAVSGTLDSSAAGTGSHSGGLIELTAGAGDLTVTGTIRANGSGMKGDGGQIVLSGAANHSIAVSGTLQAITNSTTDGEDGTINVGPLCDPANDGPCTLGQACDVIISGTLDTAGSGGYGINEVVYRGTLNVANSATMRASSSHGRNTIVCRANGSTCAQPPNLGSATITPSALPAIARQIVPCVGCPNGIVDPGEQCDDGNVTNADGCTNTCKYCGNGTTDPGEECDDGNAVNNDGCDVNCTHSRCANGILNPGEQCDDGNTTAGDGCSPTCGMEQTFRVDGSTGNAYDPSVSPADGGLIFTIVWTDDRRSGGLSTCSSEVWGRTYSPGPHGGVPTTVGVDFPVASCNGFAGSNVYPSIITDSHGDSVVAWRNLSRGVWKRVVGTTGASHPFGPCTDATSCTVPAHIGLISIAGPRSFITTEMATASPPTYNPSAFQLFALDGSPEVSCPFPSGLGLPTAPLEAIGDNEIAWINAGVHITQFLGFPCIFGQPVRADVGGSPVQKSVALGGHVIVWADTRSGSAKIFGRVLSGTGGYTGSEFDEATAFDSAEFQVSEGTGGEASPSVGVASNGRFLAAWLHPGCGTSQVMARYFDANGVPLTSTVTLGDAAPTGNPRVGGLLGGDFIVAWTKMFGTKRGVVATQYSPP